MGGRGTFAVNNPVPFLYKTVGYIEGVKVLEGINGKHSLPESSHSSWAYIKLYPDGTFHEMRIYDKHHILRFEIAYHREKSLVGNNHTPILHYHKYDYRFSVNKIGEYGRTSAKPLTDALIRKFKKYMPGVKFND